MTPPNYGPHFGHQLETVPSSEWQASGYLYTRSQLMACLRAAIIALLLLGGLALIVLF